MIKNNSVNIIFFLVAFLFLVFVSVKQVVVNSDHVQFSYKQLLLSPKTFLRSLASVKNSDNYVVSLEEVEKYQSKLDAYLTDVQTGYVFNDVINVSTNEEKLYFAGTNDHENWDLVELNLSSKKPRLIVSDINYQAETFINVYQPIFKKIAYPVCVKGGCDIYVVDVDTTEIVQKKPTLISSLPSDKAEFISNFFYDETTNIVGYKNDNPDDNKFYTIDLSIESQENSSLQIVFLETAGQDFKFLFYYPETQMMLFRSDKKPGSQSNHPDTEYFLYATNRPALVPINPKP